jgi:hypothetical protein
LEQSPIYHGINLCASTCTKIFILSRIENDFHFRLLSIFHPLAVKSSQSTVKVKSHSNWESEEIHLCAFLLNVSLIKTHSLCCNGHFLEHLSDKRDTLLLLSFSYIKMQQDQSWPNAGGARITAAEKYPHV